jgi:hypothetical protein
MSTFETKCRCGAITLRVSAEPRVQLFCHCDDCRAAHGGAYVAAAVFPAPTVEVTGGEPVATIVRTVHRMRCPDCATHLYSELAPVGMRSVNAFLLPKGAFKPQFHVQCQHAVLPVLDDLPHYKGFPAMFGGAEEFVAW